MSSSTFPRTKPSNHLLNKIFTLFIHAKSKNNRFLLISDFVTIRNTKGYKHLCKRCPFILQKGVFYTSKGHLLLITCLLVMVNDSICYFETYRLINVIIQVISLSSSGIMRIPLERVIGYFTAITFAST